MNGYYQQPGMGGGMGYPGGGGGMGMDPRMQMQMQQQQQQQMMGGGPMGMGMQQPGMGMMGGMGNLWRNLGYDYQLPTSGYKPEATWGAWDLANAQYSGSNMDRGFFDTVLNGLSNFFPNRHLTEDAARDAHRRVYFLNEGPDSGSKTLGGAAAYQAFLIWDRDHYSAYHSLPTVDNRKRLAGLAFAELHRLWDSVQPRSSRARTEDASEYATATAQHLFDRHYDVNTHHSGGRRNGWFGGDDDSDVESERRHRRRSIYENNMGMGQGMPGQGMMPGQSGPGMYPNQQMMGMGGGGMMGGGMPMMNGYNPMMNGGQMGQMGQMGGMGMGMGGMGMGGMGYPQQGMMGQGGLAMGMIPMGGGMGIPESQAAPGMHPNAYGTQSGVAWGNQAIDQMGNPTYPGGRYGNGGGGYQQGGYGYGQPRYY